MTEHFHGGSAVPGGYYLNASRWAVAPVARDGDRLPAGPGEWRRIPMVVALALVPVLGVTFVIFMPVAGFVVLIQHLVGKLRRLFARPPAADPVAGPPARGEAESRRASQG